MAFGNLETFSLSHNFPLSSNLDPDMFSNHPGFPLDDSQPSNYAGVTGSNTKAEHIDITVDDSQCPPSAGESQITAWCAAVSSSIQHELEELAVGHQSEAPQPSARPPVPTEAHQSAPVTRSKPMKHRGNLATKLKAVCARLNPSPQPLQRTLSPAPSTTSSSPAISSITPPSYPASPAPTIADSPDENITWDGNSGDCIRTAKTAANWSGRDTSFVWYDLQVDIHAHHRNRPPVFETQCFYGQLHMILTFILPDHKMFGAQPSRRLLAVVQSCDTDGSDATFAPVTYRKMRTSMQVIELTAISCVIGRVPIGTTNMWGIIDRSPAFFY
ncbi:hypothetical protein JB92DRAFT_3110713 [Gautieria morchelliformis]|nr:hypothetical protein JB92DRAFT_3110713 [Gautieria morchelliformis]